MAAGLPILANNTSFVRQIIESSETGLVVDFGKAHEITKAVSWFLSNPEARRDMGQKAVLHFKNEFNWNKVSEPMYKVIEDLVADSHVSALRIFPERIQQRLYFPISLYLASMRAVVLKLPLKFMQMVWRLLPVGFQRKFGPKLRRKLKSVFH